MTARQFKALVPRLLIHAFLVAVSLTCIFPLWWMLSSALKTQQTVFTDMSLIPDQPRWSNFVEAWTADRGVSVPWESAAADAGEEAARRIDAELRALFALDAAAMKNSTPGATRRPSVNAAAAASRSGSRAFTQLMR